MKYWYQTMTEFCPVCGKESTYRVRVYDEKDKGRRMKEQYDWCGI